MNYFRKILLLCFMLSCPAVLLYPDDSAPQDSDNADPFAGKILKMHVSLFNNPSYWFEDGVWQQEDAYTSLSGGDNEIVSRYQFNVIKKVRYYRYKHTHPLDSAYYHRQDEKTANFLKRFCFYRFTGKTLIPAVDVYLFALDMQTGLMFSYALPTRFEKVWGHRIPRDWIPIEEHPYVQEHFPGRMFYELDPVGIVLPNDKILLYDWIVKQNKRKAGDILNYVPRLGDYTAPASDKGPGYSPYKDIGVKMEEENEKNP